MANNQKKRTKGFGIHHFYMNINHHFHINPPYFLYHSRLHILELCKIYEIKVKFYLFFHSFCGLIIISYTLYHLHIFYFFIIFFFFDEQEFYITYLYYWKTCYSTIVFICVIYKAMSDFLNRTNWSNVCIDAIRRLALWEFSIVTFYFSFLF